MPTNASPIISSTVSVAVSADAILKQVGAADGQSWLDHFSLIVASVYYLHRHDLPLVQTEYGPHLLISSFTVGRLSLVKLFMYCRHLSAMS